MMGRTHMLTGALTGVALSPLLATSLPDAVLLTAVTAGFALVPDLDHPDSLATRLLGPVTGLVSRGVRAGSRRLYLATRTTRDVWVDGEHRAATHTLLFAAWVGVLVGVGSWVAGSWWVGGVVLVGSGLAGRSLGRRVAPLAAAGVLGWVAGLPDGEVAAWRVGAAAGVGCLVHCLGDAVTLSGCPLLWPLRVRGQVWFRVRLPAGWRLRTDGVVERRVVLPLCRAGLALWVSGHAVGWAVEVLRV